MFFTNLDVKRYEERRNGMQAREKEGLCARGTALPR